MEENTKEWLSIESMISGLADIARTLKEMDCKEAEDNNTSDEICKTSYKDNIGKFLKNV